MTAAEPEAADDFEPGPLPPFDPLAREPFPPALDDLTATYDKVGDGITFERWLDGFVRDPSKRPRPGRGRIYERRQWCRLEEWTEALLREAATRRRTSRATGCRTRATSRRRTTPCCRAAPRSTPR
ncbi:hypothetical protein ABZV14_42490 [Streptosporangium canum]|uniref:hypothetical protein n=1 Tax=Streptosporangium canum TaxID=324952 RepID=UPI0033AF8D96